jgi:hypothetical protein
MAVYPACIIKHSPLPRGFLPKPGKPKAKALPYPSEDARGLAYEAWPLEYRMLFGFLPREGMRTSEACGLTWGDLSLDVGAVRLDINKTDHARAWAMDPGVTQALSLWKKMRKDTKPGDLVFKRPDGAPHDTDRLASIYRDYLEKACDARREILTKGTNRMRARAHDLRGMFATYSLANGKTESWCQDRAGWTTSQMVNRYRQASRMVAELGLGDLVPLVDAVPELAAAKVAAQVAAAGEEQRAEKRPKPLKVHGRGVEPLCLSAVEPKFCVGAGSGLFPRNRGSEGLDPSGFRTIRTIRGRLFCLYGGRSIKQPGCPFTGRATTDCTQSPLRPPRNADPDPASPEPRANQIEDVHALVLAL